MSTKAKRAAATEAAATEAAATKAAATKAEASDINLERKAQADKILNSLSMFGLSSREHAVKFVTNLLEHNAPISSDAFRERMDAIPKNKQNTALVLNTMIILAFRDAGILHELRKAIRESQGYEQAQSIGNGLAFEVNKLFSVIRAFNSLNNLGVFSILCKMTSES